MTLSAQPGHGRTALSRALTVLTAVIALVSMIAGAETTLGAEPPSIQASLAHGPTASASSFRRCAKPLGYTPKNGGYGLIIEKMHVQRITCNRAAKIGGAFYAGDPMPKGWTCGYSEADYFTHCRYRSSRHAFRFVFGGDAGRTSTDAQASSRRRDAISFRGIGGIRWGAKLTRVETALGISFDCSEGLIPGHCLCPPSEPDLSLLFVFDSRGPQDARLQAVFGGGRAHTPAGIAIGSSKRAVEKAYPGARYKVNAPIDSGLSTLLLARHNGHALLFYLSNGHVNGISGYANGSAGNLEAEQCA